MAHKSKGGLKKLLIVVVAALLGGSFMLMMMAGAVLGANSSSTSYSDSLSDEVLQYQSLVTEYAEKYGISEYVYLILCIMQVESGGRGLDPMQSSECSYNTKYPKTHNGITDPEYSISCGVQYLRDCLNNANVESPEETEQLYLPVQAYNFGIGYISWAVSNYGGYTQENAQEFSDKKKSELGWSVYGNPTYAVTVMEYYQQTLTGTGEFIYPVPGYTSINSGYGMRTNPVTGVYTLHKGVDFAAPAGTDIVASASGKVISSGWSNSYGYRIEIQHSNGYVSTYSHCSKLYIDVGQVVTQGETIAAVGTTGNSTGNHLHFEIWTNAKTETIDPVEVLPSS